MKNFNIRTISHIVNFDNDEIAHQFNIDYQYANKYYFYASVVIKGNEIFGEIDSSLDYFVSDEDLSYDVCDNFHYDASVHSETRNMDDADILFFYKNLNRILNRLFYISYITIQRDEILTNIDDLDMINVDFYQLDIPHRQLVRNIMKHIVAIMSSEMKVKDFLEI